MVCLFVLIIVDIKKCKFWISLVYYYTALHSCSAKFRYGNKCWSAWSKPNWNSLAQTLEPEYDPGEVTGGLWVGRSQTYARPV